MNEKQHKIVKLLWQFNSLREKHILRLCNCSTTDIDVLIANKTLIREKTGIIRYRPKEVNNRNVAAFDVIMEFLERNPKIKKGKFPVSVKMQIGYINYDIIAVKEKEIDNLYKNIDSISNADKIIIIIETKNYKNKKINTNKECLICKYPPIEIVDKIN